MRNNDSSKPTILFGVTLDRSINLMRGLPERLVARGWEVHLVSSPGANLSAYQSIGGITIHEIDMERTPSFFRDVRALFLWIRMLRRVRPQVVSIGTPKASLLGIAGAFITRVPRRIYHLRGLRLETLHGVRRSLLVLVERLIMFAATEVLAISPSLRAAAINMKLTTAQKIEVVASGSSNGIDLNHFKMLHDGVRDRAQLAEKLQIDLAVPVLGFVGRLNKDKGLGLLQRVSKTLSVEGVSHQLLIIGTTEDESLAEQLRQHSRVTRVTLMDRVENIAPFYHLMTCLVFPTRREGFGNVSIEAQASGIPVITTDATGAVDTVINHVSGLIVPKDDHQEMAKAIKAVLSQSIVFRPENIRRSAARFDRAAVQTALVSYYERGG